MRDILHCDLNNFFASVECAENPQLQKHKYLAVSGSPKSRHGIILAKNTAAKAMGVKTGEVLWQALQKCPELVCVAPHPELYVDYSKKVREIYLKYTDLVESFGIDECWLDVTHSKIFGTPFEIAEKIRKEVRETYGVTVSIGVSFNKVFAKLGSDLKKPDAVTVIDQNNFRDVVWKLNVDEMLNIGKKTKTKLNAMGIFDLGQLANADPVALKTQFGVVGERMQKCALGLDDEEVQNCEFSREIKSVGHGTTTLRDMKSYADGEIVINYLSDMVATRMRRYGYKGTVVHLSLRSNDLTVVGKQKSVSATFVSGEISHYACDLLKQLWNPASHLPLRSLTVSVGGLVPVGQANQMSLFDAVDEKKDMLEFYVDQIRKKYGYFAITKASLLGNDLVCDKFCDEDSLLPFSRKQGGGLNLD